jgi:hypothetical protein
MALSAPLNNIINTLLASSTTTTIKYNMYIQCSFASTLLLQTNKFKSFQSILICFQKVLLYSIKYTNLASYKAILVTVVMILVFYFANGQNFHYPII